MPCYFIVAMLCIMFSNLRAMEEQEVVKYLVVFKGNKEPGIFSLDFFHIQPAHTH